MAEKNELMTIKAFAEAAGRSQQAIYKQIGTRLSAYLHEIDGQKYIERRALFEVFHIGEEVEQCNFNSTNHKKGHSDKTLELLEKTIQMLEDQLKAKDREIAKLTETIQAQARGINGAQALHAETMQQLGSGEVTVEADVVDVSDVEPGSECRDDELLDISQKLMNQNREAYTTLAGEPEQKASFAERFRKAMKILKGE